MVAKYRYRLNRTWDESRPPVCWVMLNPSTADAETDDPTIRRCMGFARDWGHGGIVVVNLFAWRATDPRKLCMAGDPVGPENDRHIIDACAGELVVVAWGTNAPAARASEVLRLIKDNALMIRHLGKTKGGHPRHPLYVPATQPLLPWDQVNENHSNKPA